MRDKSWFAETGFTSSNLWQEALAPRASDRHRQPRERLRSAYIATRENTAVLLGELARTMPAFTVHDITHADALWETADLLCTGTALPNPAEMFILGCAFLLHDAAMGLAAYPGDDLVAVLGSARWQDLVSLTFADRHGRWPTEQELAEPPDDVRAACTHTAIRETHAEHAARLVEQSWTTTAGNDLYLIQDIQLRESYGPIVGELAASHWLDAAQLPDRFRGHRGGSLPWQPSQWTIDPLKLACILRLADAIQIDSRRAPTFLRSLRAPEGVAADHWQFQEHMGRPQLNKDRVVFTALRPFLPQQARSWWLALDYLRGVDMELKAVDALLHDLQRPRLAASAVAGVDLPERFAELFPVQGWRPVNIDLTISNIRNLVQTLGGPQLYGIKPETAVRELLQNAQDAVQARRVLDPTFTDESVEVSLAREDTIWTLEIRDNGVGMDEEMLIDGLLDFGSSGWRSSAVRAKLVGLSAGGFQPKGRFGIGFFSVFMIGSDVTVTTRRFDGGRGDARQLRFDGLAVRPLLTTVDSSTYVPPGTTVRVVLKNDPVSRDGILAQTRDSALGELVERLMPESSVRVATIEWDGYQFAPLLPFDLASAPAEEIYDRLYPPSRVRGEFGEHQQRALRDEFVQQATELKSNTGERLGYASLGDELTYQSNFHIFGIVTVDGFRADQNPNFAGYIAGRSDKSSRYNVEFAATDAEFAGWIRTQVLRRRQREQFSPSFQIENARFIYRILGELTEDHYVGITEEGLIQLLDIGPWAARRTEIFCCFETPLLLWTRPPHLRHYHTEESVILPDNWLHITQWWKWPELFDLLPRHRDPAFELHRHDHTPTWQKEWWHMSGELTGEVFRRICQAWGCSIGEVLRPIAARGWKDHAVPMDGMDPISVFHLRHP
jgi:hypothetical protein